MKTEFSIKELIDYSKCPHLYKLKYLECKSDESINIAEKYENDLKQVAYRLFRTIADHGEIKLIELKALWGTLWIKKKSKDNFIYQQPKSWRDTFGQYDRRGIKALMNIYNLYEENPGTPIVVDTEYKLKISDDIYVKGKWDLVREIEIKDKKYTEIVLLNTLAYIKRINKAKDIEPTLASMAFRINFKFKEDILSYHHLDRQKIVKTPRDSEDFAQAILDIKNIVKAIRMEIFYTVPTESCSICAYKDVCYNSFKKPKGGSQ